jgi:murein L,D-transpeptidase YcbB/YkuD
MVYFTAWVGEDGELNFRDDVYGRDAVLSSALLARDDSGGAALRQR